MNIKFHTRSYVFKLFILLSIGTFGSCLEKNDSQFDLPNNARAFRPVYLNADSASQIKVADKRSITHAGKIITYNRFLIVNSVNTGFHIIDNSNPSEPENILFVEIPGSTDISIKDDVMFTNNYRDIIAFKINVDRTIQIIKRFESVLDEYPVPPIRNVYFECVDSTKGIVVDWVETTNKTNIKCRN